MLSIWNLQSETCTICNVYGIGNPILKVVISSSKNWTLQGYDDDPVDIWIAHAVFSLGQLFVIPFGPPKCYFFNWIKTKLNSTRSGFLNLDTKKAHPLKEWASNFHHLYQAKVGMKNPVAFTKLSPNELNLTELIWT